jgi:hypothetical protein
MPVLTRDEIKAFSNPYLLFGHKSDVIRLEELSIENNVLLATLNVESIFFESHTAYHFPSIPASTWIQQFCYIYAKWDNQPKQGYVNILLEHIEFKKFITTKSIHFQLRFKKKKIKDAVLYITEGEAEQGKLILNGKFIFSPEQLYS